MIRELTPSDRAAVVFSLAHLGAQSHYQRYLGGRPAASTEELARLVALDHWHHEVLIAFSTHPRVPVGLSEYIRLERFDTAELAISVIDAWQRHGIGIELLLRLRERALAAGIRRFSAMMLRGNRGALALARHLGEVSTQSARGNIVELMIEL
jgi:acetyltransferase